MMVTEHGAPANTNGAVGRENVTLAPMRAVTSFPPSDRILSTILTRQAERHGERVLLVAGETRWSFAQTAAIAAASARALVDAGIKPGDRVALMCSNRPEFLQVYLGCAWLGAIAVPINTALRGVQLSHIFRNSRPALLVVEAQFAGAIDSVEAGAICRLGPGSSELPMSQSMPGCPRCRCRLSEPRRQRALSALATPLRSSTHRGPPGLQRVCVVRRRNCSGGASIRRVRSASARAMCCSRRCPCSTPTR